MFKRDYAFKPHWSKKNKSLLQPHRVLFSAGDFIGFVSYFTFLKSEEAFFIADRYFSTETIQVMMCQCQEA